MTLDETDLKTVESTPGNSGKIISQNPAAGQKGAKGQAVQVTLGAQMVAVPLLIGHQYKDVMGILSGQSLAVGQNKTAANPNFAAGVVFDQSPAPQQLVKSGTAVDVQVTPTTVTVTPVIGQTLGNASNALGAIGLRVTSLSGDSNLTVIGQNPGPGTTVPVGTPVALTFPPGTCVGAICYYNGIIAQQMVAEQAMRAKTGHW
jgi:beta-lactam-binding protein with PASTA domain